jgi:hypothetical protein
MQIPRCVNVIKPKEKGQMEIKVVKYRLTNNQAIQAFIDITIDDWLRINRLHFHRDGDLKSAHLHYNQDGEDKFSAAVQIVDPDRNSVIKEAIRQAVRAYIETLPPNERERLPRVKQKKPQPGKQAAPTAPTKPAIPPPLQPKAPKRQEIW